MRAPIIAFSQHVDSVRLRRLRVGSLEHESGKPRINIYLLKRSMHAQLAFTSMTFSSATFPAACPSLNSNAGKHIIKVELERGDILGIHYYSGRAQSRDGRRIEISTLLATRGVATCFECLFSAKPSRCRYPMATHLRCATPDPK